MSNSPGPQTAWKVPSRTQATTSGSSTTAPSHNDAFIPSSGQTAIEIRSTAGNNPKALSDRLGPVTIGDSGRRIDEPLHYDEAVSARTRKASLGNELRRVKVTTFIVR